MNISQWRTYRASVLSQKYLLYHALHNHPEVTPLTFSYKTKTPLDGQKTAQHLSNHQSFDFLFVLQVEARLRQEHFIA
jgi:hypothetical protein